MGSVRIVLVGKLFFDLSVAVLDDLGDLVGNDRIRAEIVRHTRTSDQRVRARAQMVQRQDVQEVGERPRCQ